MLLVVGVPVTQGISISPHTESLTQVVYASTLSVIWPPSLIRRASFPPTLQRLMLVAAVALAHNKHLEASTGVAL